jgi:nucleotide-binding universal stress UspA family protein
MVLYGLKRWVLGSVTDKVIHAGDVPVLVMRAAGRPKEGAIAL